MVLNLETLVRAFSVLRGIRNATFHAFAIINMYRQRHGKWEVNIRRDPSQATSATFTALCLMLVVLVLCKA